MLKNIGIKRTFFVIALTLALTLATSLFQPLPAKAAESTHKTIKVGFFAMDGYHMQDKAGVRSGYGYDFLQLVSRYSNLKFEYVGYEKSWDDMQQMLIDGKIDLLTSAQKTPRREALFDFTSTQIGTSAAILTVKAGDDRYSDGNYNGMRIGIVKNNTRNNELDRFMAEKGFDYTPVYYYSMDELTEALQKGKDIDAAMSSNLRWTENEWTLEEFSSSPFYAMVRKGDTKLLSEVNEAIRQMDMGSPGWRTKFFNKHYSMGSGDVVAFSGEERAYIDQLNSDNRILKVTMNPDCAPYSYFESGKAKGIIPDIFTEVADRMGIKYEMIEPADREEYYELCVDGDADIILDGMNDFYTIEQNNLEITDPYYTAPLAVITTKTNTDEIKSLAQPKVSLLNESYYSSVFSNKTSIKSDYSTFKKSVKKVKSGKADGTYMPYYCAQWLCNSDITGKLQCIMLSGHDRDFVYAVSSDEDYLLLSSLNRAVGSLSDDYIASIVTSDTVYPDKTFSLTRFLYQNLALVSVLIILFIVIAVAALFFAGKNHRAQKELSRSRRMERYIGYLCDIHYKVMEVDLDLPSRKQYMKKNGVVEIEERDDFTSFDIESIHPEDLESSLSIFNPEAIRALATSGEDERYVESRMKGPDGEYRWYSFLLKLIPKDDEHPCSAVLLIKDIESLHQERQENHDALAGALEVANAASHSKSTFLSSMSHEIRTPLNAMIGYMTIASTAIDDREKVIHCIDSAGVAARHLLSIINDILDISAMESGKIKLVKERFDLKEQLSGISTVFYQQCRQKNVEFTISIENLTEEWVIGDSMRINQILMNLMSNAVKFTEGGGSVNLIVTQTSRNENQVYIRFIVKDTGIGMSEDYLERLFSPFEQESAQTTRKYGGTGLGMSITYNLVNLIGGNIDVTSKQGEGTAFTVTLPFDRTDNDEIISEGQDFSHLRVLIVDDLENECDYIHALLTRCGIYSESARSGEEAIRLVSANKDTSEKFDLCIIDWNMPNLDGVETTKLIHRECDPDIPIIIATAYDISEFRESAIAAGAVKIISKPLFQSTLLDMLVSTYGRYNPVIEDDDEIPDLEGMKVLLAEDNETNAEIAVDILEIAGVAVDVVQNGREAVEMFMSNGRQYDAILMDVQMPIMDGYTATKTIRKSDHEKAQSIPIIAITADALAENVASALAAGMNDHVAKPIETDVLFTVLKKVYKK